MDNLIKSLKRKKYLKNQKEITYILFSDYDLANEIKLNWPYIASYKKLLIFPDLIHASNESGGGQSFLKFMSPNVVLTFPDHTKAIAALNPDLSYAEEKYRDFRAEYFLKAFINPWLESDVNNPDSFLTDLLPYFPPDYIRHIILRYEDKKVYNPAPFTIQHTVLHELSLFATDAQRVAFYNDMRATGTCCNLFHENLSELFKLAFSPPSDPSVDLTELRKQELSLERLVLAERVLLRLNTQMQYFDDWENLRNAHPNTIDPQTLDGTLRRFSLLDNAVGGLERRLGMETQYLDDANAGIENLAKRLVKVSEKLYDTIGQESNALKKRLESAPQTVLLDMAWWNDLQNTQEKLLESVIEHEKLAANASTEITIQSFIVPLDRSTDALGKDRAGEGYGCG